MIKINWILITVRLELFASNILDQDNVDQDNTTLMGIADYGDNGNV